LRLVHTNVRVRDIDASLRFHEALGFERRGRLQFEGAYNIYLGLPRDSDTLELTFNEGRAEPYDLGSGYGHVAIAVEYLDGLLERLAAQGIEPEKPPYHPGRPDRVPDLLRRRPGRLPHRADRRRLRDAAGPRPLAPRLEQLDRIAGRILDQDLAAAAAADDLVAEADSASRSATSSCMRFQPPGSGMRPSGVGWAAPPGPPGEFSSSRRSPRESTANPGAGCI
jgi:lactoylglutathione lyase